MDVDEHVRESLTALQDAYVYLTIRCGAQVRDLARSYNMALHDLRNAAQDRQSWDPLRSRSRSLSVVAAAARRDLLIVCTPGGQLTMWYPDQHT